MALASPMTRQFLRLIEFASIRLAFPAKIGGLPSHPMHHLRPLSSVACKNFSSIENVFAKKFGPAGLNFKSKQDNLPCLSTKASKHFFISKVRGRGKYDRIVGALPYCLTCENCIQVRDLKLAKSTFQGLELVFRSQAFPSQGAQILLPALELDSEALVDLAPTAGLRSPWNQNRSLIDQPPRWSPMSGAHRPIS